MPLDAIPDLSDTQVIVYSRWDRSPDIMEDQVTYPIVTAMLGAPKVKDVRGFSDFGYSYVYIIFEEGTDIYWARSRTLEYLSSVLPRLPQGVKTELGPDATGVGWVFQYALVDTTGKHSLAELRSLPGLVPALLPASPCPAWPRSRRWAASCGSTRSTSIPTGCRPTTSRSRKVVEAVRGGNNDVGGRLVEFGGARVHGARPRLCAIDRRHREHRRSPRAQTASPIRVRDVGEVVLGPDIRRGVADLDGTGEAVAGIVVMRQGENALRRDRAGEGRSCRRSSRACPPGVKIVTAYDRSELIQRSIDNLKHTLIEEMVIVAIVILIFLWHIPSAIIPDRHHSRRGADFLHSHAHDGHDAPTSCRWAASPSPSARMVDAAIVVVEQTHKKLEEWERDGRQEDYHRRGHRRGEGSRRAELLRAAGDRGLVPAGADAGSAGRPALQAAGLHQELRHDRGGGAGHHARPGAAPAVHAHAAISTSGRAGWRASPTPCWWARSIPRRTTRSAAS